MPLRPTPQPPPTMPRLIPLLPPPTIPPSSFPLPPPVLNLEPHPPTPAPLFHGSSRQTVVDPTLFCFLLLVGMFSFFLLRIYIQHLRGRAASGGNPCDSESAWWLDHQALATSMPSIRYADAAAAGLGITDCAVCLEEFGEDDPVRILRACRHTFHRDCIDVWLLDHVTCPVCRADLETPPMSWRPCS